MDRTTMAETRRGRRGPVEGEHLIGYDREPARRPGVPMHATPHAHPGGPTSEPVEQSGVEQRIHRASLDRPTPVFGTAQPLHGVSGLIRRGAYGVPEHHARHWLLLMAADRVDVLEDRLGTLLATPVSAVGGHAAAERIRSNPLPYLAGFAMGAILARKILR
jgi:hypothetical protein